MAGGVTGWGVRSSDSLHRSQCGPCSPTEGLSCCRPSCLYSHRSGQGPVAGPANRSPPAPVAWALRAAMLPGLGASVSLNSVTPLTLPTPWNHVKLLCL